VKVLRALQNASVVTDPGNPQIVSNGGPAHVQALVAALGHKSTSTSYIKETLSSGVTLLSKPSKFHVPPWQMVSSLLDGVSLRAAAWWAAPKINTTTASTKIGCWDDQLSKAGAVAIATTGTWEGTNFGLTGGPGPNFNQAKVGVSTSGSSHYSIFGDMNQQGALSGKCSSSQNGRGGLFYVVDDEVLFNGVTALIKGSTAPAETTSP
jgi:hypothetical protein